MWRSLKSLTLVLALIGAAGRASAFSLLGPYDGFQIEQIGYNIQPPFFDDIGAPMNLGEEYRWNVRTIYFGFDNTFKDYFGVRGMQEVRKAVAIINNLPPFSRMSADLREFPTEVKRTNFRASGLGLFDLKSYALTTLMEEMGLASPERYVWCLRQRVTFPTFTNYAVIMRNFDPVTLAPSKYVNDALYTYTIQDGFGAPRPVADAVEQRVDPAATIFTSVASGRDSWLTLTLNYGDYFTGLTRDDIGGLRYLYCGRGPYQNFNIEDLVLGAITNGIGGGSAWSPAGTTGSVGPALRPGIDKIVFKEAQYDSTLGFFIQFTNNNTDVYVRGGHLAKQTFQRAFIQPDILFEGSDLLGGTTLRADTAGWANNSALGIVNGGSTIVNAGPGVIQPGTPFPVFIVFNKIGPVLINQFPGFIDEGTASFNYQWGSFDGTTNDPVVYPNLRSIQDVEQQVLGGN